MKKNSEIKNSSLPFILFTPLHLVGGIKLPEEGASFLSARMRAQTHAGTHGVEQNSQENQPEYKKKGQWTYVFFSEWELSWDLRKQKTEDQQEKHSRKKQKTN